MEKSTPLKEKFNVTYIGKDWCWEGLGAGGEGDNRVWDGWMASLTRWTSEWVSLSELWELVMDREAWRPATHGVTKSQTRLRDWTELNWFHCILQLIQFPVDGNHLDCFHCGTIMSKAVANLPIWIFVYICLNFSGQICESLCKCMCKCMFIIIKNWQAVLWKLYHFILPPTMYESS